MYIYLHIWQKLFPIYLLLWQKESLSYTFKTCNFVLVFQCHLQAILASCIPLLLVYHWHYWKNYDSWICSIFFLPQTVKFSPHFFWLLMPDGLQLLLKVGLESLWFAKKQLSLKGFLQCFPILEVQELPSSHQKFSSAIFLLW